jgi:hypothetical protein
MQADRWRPLAEGGNDVLFPPCIEKLSDRLSSEEPLPPRRHGVGSVLFAQGDEAVEVPRLPSLTITIQQEALIAWSANRLLRGPPE